MDKNSSSDKKVIKDIIGAFYTVPFISHFVLISIITGESKWGPYREGINSIQVRLIGLIFFFFCMYITYFVLIKWPKTIGGRNKVNEVLSNFFRSLFFIFWLLSIVLSLLYEIYQLILIKIAYFVIIGICLYYQVRFIRKIKKIVE